MPEQGKNPLIIVSESTWMAAGVFNPNDWTGDSKGIIQFCSTEYGVLLHCRDQIVKACEGSAVLCAEDIRILQKQWRTLRFDPSRIEAFAEIPQVHVQIEAFLSATKTLLDLVVQLLASEGVVSASVHGFHEKGTKVLKTLSNNATAQRKVTATQIERLISAHKEIWIDKAIAARDDLTGSVRSQTTDRCRPAMQSSRVRRQTRREQFPCPRWRPISRRCLTF